VPFTFTLAFLLPLNWFSSCFDTLLRPKIPPKSTQIGPPYNLCFLPCFLIRENLESFMVFKNLAKKTFLAVPAVYLKADNPLYPTTCLFPPCLRKPLLIQKKPHITSHSNQLASFLYHAANPSILLVYYLYFQNELPSCKLSPIGIWFTLLILHPTQCCS